MFLGGSSMIFAQDRCATTYLQKLQNRPKEADLQFEKWFKGRVPVSAQEKKEKDGTKRTKAAYQIPVVVHIIHNGEQNVTNIPDAQVLSQIRVLNEDFNRLNVDASNTPTEFLDEAGSLDVEFVLAKRTPEGLPTTGINRVLGTKTKWQVSDNYTLKSLSYWPAEDYLNIWVCNLESYLGYSQFPQSDLIGGLENSSTNRETDGVVIVYDAFGSIDDGNFSLDAKFNKGRTATHEVGHYLGLRHISGDDDGDCGNDGDYVDDTPDQASQTYECPSHPRLSCTLTSMFQNYLDYTNDACMNLFTKGQVERMKIILENSPRRKTLNLSLGATEPDPVADDLGIKSILSPQAGECAAEVSPSIEIRNYGNNPITSAQIRMQRDGATVEIIDYTQTIAVNETKTITFSPVTLEGGSSVFTFQILQTNGTADGNAFNDMLQRTVLVPTTITVPVSEKFNTLPDQWLMQNPDGLFSWEIANVPLGSVPNKALLMNFYDYEDSDGEIDVLVSPLIDLSTAPVALLLFDIAHARYQSSADGLKVVVLSNCNSNLNEAEMLYEKSGTTLATTTDTNEAFVPTTASQWRTESIDLAPYIGQKIQLAFIGVNDWGNNLYLDNIRILTNSFLNLTLLKVISPAPANCSSSLQPKLLVRNSGTAISSFNVAYTVNGTTIVHPVELNLEAGAEAEVTLPSVDLNDGINDLVFTLEDPDGSGDVDPTDNTIVMSAGLNQETTGIPFRENFENGESSWLSINPNEGMSWETTSVHSGTAIYHQGFDDAVIGSEAWLISPSMDLSPVEKATLYFDLSYALRNSTSDQLQVRASLGCSSAFDVILATYSGDQLSENSRVVPWSPQNTDDWKTRSLNLASVLGQPEVRLAFVLTNQQSNNIYLDNIELFLSDETSKVDVDGLFNVFPNPLQVSDNSSIAFKFAELENIRLQITDNLGRSVYEASYENILNQIVELPVEHYHNGMYHIRVFASGKLYSSKLIIAR
jgi:hypothetical protein